MTTMTVTIIAAADDDEDESRGSQPSRDQRRHRWRSNYSSLRWNRMLRVSVAQTIPVALGGISWNGPNGGRRRRPDARTMDAFVTHVEPSPGCGLRNDAVGVS